MRMSSQQRRIVLGNPAGWIALGVGSGLSPVAPGTVGSLVALLPWLLLRELDVWLYLGVVAAAFVVGVWSCRWVVARLHIDDPSFVVCDEFVGEWIALIPLVLIRRSWLWIFAGFILFRIFDIWKPWPVSWADRDIKGGFGVMLDDVVAGVYAAAVLWLLLVLTR
ncbi:MAG TPA: phosphatidylglycerophosphatase A [Rudaea sp.]|nr:phosphatidylglycerophosphatase A [Rudaea sp.]